MIRTLLLRWTGLVIPLSAAAILVALTGADGALRTLIVVSFLGFCPGLVLMRLLGLRFDPVVDAGYAVATSIAIGGIAAGIGLYAGEWRPNGIVGILGVLSLSVAVAAATRTAVRAEPAAAPRPLAEPALDDLAPQAEFEPTDQSSAADDQPAPVDELDELRAALRAARDSITEALGRDFRRKRFGRTRR